MSLKLDSLLGSFDAKTQGGDAKPPQYPVTIRDLDHAAQDGKCFDMFLPMADPCPKCGAFKLRVGDYVCAGTCLPCWKEAEPEIWP